MNFTPNGGLELRAASLLHGTEGSMNSRPSVPSILARSQSGKDPMTTKQRYVTAALLALLVGCSRTDQSEKSKKPDQPVTAREARQQYQESVTAAKNYVAESKDEFVAAMDRKLQELDGRIRQLGQKSESYKDDAKAQAEQTLTALREQRNLVSGKFEEMKKASTERWNEAKASFFSAMGELEKACDNARSKLSELSP